MGLELTRFELDRVYREVIALADRQKSVDDEEVAAIVARVRQAEYQSGSSQAQPTARTA